MRAATFTTYWNAKNDPGAFAALDKLTDVAVSRYGTIARAAEEASRAASGLLGASGSAGRSASQARDLKTLADAERAVGQAASSAKRELSTNATAVRNQGREARQAAGHNEALARSLKTTATALNIVQGPLGPLAGRVTAISNAVAELTGFRLGLAGLGSALFAIGRAGNSYAVLQSRLLPFFETQQAANQAMNDAIGIAKRSRAPLESIVELYSRLTAVSADYGMSQDRVSRLVEFASKAASLSGGTAQTRSAGLNQFAQAVGKGRLNDDELKSVMENLPVLATAIARGFKDVDGSIGVAVGRLRDLGSQGKLTLEAIVEATDRSSADIEAKFAKLPLTLGAAGTEFSNSLTVMVGRFDQAVGFTASLAQGIHIIGENLRAVTALAFGFAAVLAAPRIIAGTTAIAGGINGIIARTVVAARTVKEMDAAWLEDLGAAKIAADARVRELEEERQAIRRNIVELQRKAEFARSVVNIPVSQPGQRAFARDPSTGFIVSNVQATRQLEKATLALADRQDHLTDVNKRLRAAYGVSEVAAANLGSATENVGKRMGLLKSAGLSLVNFLGGPWGIAFGLATTAIFLFATQSDRAKDALDRLGGQMGELDRQLESTTARATGAAAAISKLRDERKRDRIEEARSDLQTIRSSSASLLRAGLGQANFSLSDARFAGVRVPSKASNDALRTIEDLEKGRTNAMGALVALSRIAKSNPEIISPDAIKRWRSKGGALDTVAGAEKGYNETAAEIYGPSAFRGAGGSKAKTKAQLNAEADARSASSDLERARAEERRIRAEGKQDGETDDQYIERLALAKRSVDQLAQAEKDRRKAATAGRAEARREARDARQDALDAAAARRDASLLDLAKSGKNPRSEEYLQARIRILKTYDDEVNKIDASRAASSSAAKQMIQDAESVAKASARAGERRNDILDRYSDQPRAITAAIDKIDDLNKFVDTAVDGVAFIGKTKDEIAEISKINPLGTGIYTQAMADADARRIEQGVRKPLQDVMRDHERELEISRLVIAGRLAEADALRQAFRLYDDIGELSQEEYVQLVRNAEQQERINDALARRDRIASTMQNTVDTARDAFEQFLMDAPEDAGRAAGDLLRTIKDQVWRITTRSFTERLFAGTDEKVRSLISGRNSVDQSIYQFNGSIGKAETATTRLSSTLDKGAAECEAAFARIAQVGAPAAVPADSSRAPTAALAKATSVLASVGSTIAGQVAANDNNIVVNGKRAAQPTSSIPPGNLPTSGAIARTLFGQIGDNLDQMFAKLLRRKGGAEGINLDGSLTTGSGFFRKMGDTFGGALRGAGEGAFASGIAKALGIKQSGTGAALGGAIGNFIPGLPPGVGSILGGLLGGTIGALFNKPKYGNASVSLNQWGEAIGGTGSGRGAAQISAAGGAATSVASGVNRIMEALGATVSGLPGITIGSWDGRARVALTSTNKPLHSKNFGPDVLKDFGDDQQAAIEYAIRYSISHAVINGISQASKNIIQSGQDLEQAIQKAVAIESIPKRLMQRTDPVRYAVQSVNDEFSKLINYLKEGGASAEQFADAQKLYDLERADAIKQATSQAAGAINDFLKEMTSGSSSPYNKLTTLQNATTELDKYRSDIQAGKVVDQNDLLSAARNYQDALRGRFGSSQEFFAGFDDLRTLLEKARDNAGITNVSTLPASPFATDSTVQAQLANLAQGQIDATNSQTDALVDRLNAVIRQLGTLNGYSGEVTSDTLGLLPSFGNALAR